MNTFWMAVMTLATIACTIKVFFHAVKYLTPKYKDHKQENLTNVLIFTLLAFVFVLMGPTLQKLIEQYLAFFSNL